MFQARKTKHQLIALLISIGAVAAAGLTFLLPVASTVENVLAAHSRTAFAIALTILFSGSAAWYMAGLSAFKTRLRIAYVLLGIGLIIFSVAILQLPIIGLLDQWNSAWATGGGVILIFAASTVLMYLAMRQFGKLLSVRSMLSSVWVMLGIGIASTIAGYVVGMNWVQYELEGIDVYIAAIAWTFAWAGGATLLATKIVAVIGPAYKRALQWQAIALFGVTLGGLHEGVGALFLDNEHWFQNYGFYLWELVITGVLFVKASYEFRLITAGSAVAGSENAATGVKDRDYIESIMAIASLASRPEEIDRIMDSLRIVTARMDGATPLDDTDKRRLVDLYYQLETYLTTKDPLRTFTQEELREHVTPGFGSVLARRQPAARPQAV